MPKLIKLNVHPYNYNLFFTCSKKRFYRERTRITGSQDKPDVIGMFSYDSGNAVIGVFDNDKATLVHELAHAVIDIMVYVGMPINIDTTEAFAYLQDKLYQECVAHMERVCS